MAILAGPRRTARTGRGRLPDPAPGRRPRIEKTPAEIAKWWRSLPEEQRHLLMNAYPSKVWGHHFGERQASVMRRLVIFVVLDAGKPATALTGGPAPCDQYELKYFEGGSSPYKIAGFSSIDDIPPNKSVPAVMRLKAYAERSGWKISAFRPATGSRMSTELAGHDSHSGYGFSVEALHDVNRIVISVGSDCVRDSRDHRGKVPYSSYRLGSARTQASAPSPSRLVMNTLFGSGR